VGSSSSTKLIQEVIGKKLEQWLRYVNGESDTKYRIERREDDFVIQQLVQMKTSSVAKDGTINDSSWSFPIAHIKFKDELEASTTTKSFTIPYSDPDLYSKLFEVIDYAVARGFNDVMTAISISMSSRSDWKLD